MKKFDYLWCAEYKDCASSYTSNIWASCFGHAYSLAMSTMPSKDSVLVSLSLVDSHVRIYVHNHCSTGSLVC